jgi:hypothetical protein
MVWHVSGKYRPHTADNTARIYEKKGYLYVAHEELLSCGYRGLEDFDVVYLNGRFYELIGYIRRAKAWWIEEVKIPEAEEEAEPSSETTEGEQA